MFYWKIVQRNLNVISIVINTDVMKNKQDGIQTVHLIFRRPCSRLLFWKKTVLEHYTFHPLLTHSYSNCKNTNYDYMAGRSKTGEKTVKTKGCSSFSASLYTQRASPLKCFLPDFCIIVHNWTWQETICENIMKEDHSMLLKI